MTDPRDETIAETERLCETDPDAAAIRDALLAVEATGHRLGWDHPRNVNPPIFTLHLDPNRHLVHTLDEPEYTSLLRKASIANNHNHGRAMIGAARFFNKVNFAIRDAADPAALAAVADHYGIPRDAAEIMHQQMANGRDIHGVEEDLRFRIHGYGIRYEAWAVLGTAPELDRAQAERRLHAHPDRIEVREVQLFDRTNHLWTVIRRRGYLPQVMRLDPNSAAYAFVGGVPRGLAMMLDGVVPETIKLVPSAEKDPLFR